MPVSILFIGDIVGKPGRQVLGQLLHKLVDKYRVDLVVANGENSAGGFGITPDKARELFDLGIHVITTGNHVWDKKESSGFLDREAAVLRPANYPPGAPGHGSIIASSSGGVKIGVLNLEGRIFMSPIDCPFRIADQEVAKLKEETPIILVDFHAEATSEKMSLGWYLDGRVSAVIGTHTHVQTADERILTQGTAYITDAGMTGSFDSVIGVRKEEPIQRFLTQMPVKFEVAKKDLRLNGLHLTVDAATGKALSVERVAASC